MLIRKSILSLLAALALLPAASAPAARKAKPAETDPVYLELMARSYPVDLARRSLTNPWGERVEPAEEIGPDFGQRIATAARVYSDQPVRFDGYVGSEDDGLHYETAADGKDNAYYGSEKTKSYRLSRNGKIDDLTERVWVCEDYPVHTLTLAGFPLRDAMIADFKEGKEEYLAHGNFSANIPTTHWFFRRVLNVRRYFTRKQAYWEERIGPEQFRDPKFRPAEPFNVGDLLFFGHYGDDDKLGPWVPKHSGIVASIDARGLPAKMFNMRASSSMIDTYDGTINQWRPIGDKRVFFKRFSSRYSIVGHGRVLHPFIPPLKPNPWRPERLAEDDGQSPTSAPSSVPCGPANGGGSGPD